MIKSFEGGRGVAALIVALFHLKIAASQLSIIRNGYLLVDLFFVLSGFLMCAAYADKLEEKGAFWPFLLRRFGRLFPLLIFSTVLFVLMDNASSFAKNQIVTFGFAKFSKHIGTLPYSVPTFPEVFATVTMTHGMGLFDKLILNYASWSISVEFYAYILFACLCFLLRGWTRLAVFALVSIATFAIVVWASVDLHDCFTAGNCFDITYDFGFARCVSSFFLGALSYHLSRVVRFNPTYLQVFGLALVVAVFSLLDVYPVLTFVCPLLFALLVFSLCRDTGVLAELLKRQPFQILGQRSYSIYLMHPILLLLISPILKHVHNLVQGCLMLVGYVAVLLLVSKWTYAHIEDPWRIRFNRFAAGRQSQRVV